ncbi:MAG: MoaD/ThiS family protein [Peptococcaceae bacterium]|jgi:molybdopterin converting factor small subunit|nr:MoaD/ThiS family protein [Peptococcaceae bacterium]MDH7523911.1 MoaD/ThiS family protein [Peptococcaceae bacterium]
MRVTINFVDELCVSAGKKQIVVRVEGPVSIKKLYELAREQEGIETLYRELEGLMVCYNGRLLEHREALNKEISPGEEILLLPLMEGG